MGLYEEVLGKLSAQGRELPRPAVRASAAVVLWRRGSGGGIEVFWQQRAPTMPFMGGWHAFPGGGVKRSDADVEVVGEPAGVEGAPVAAAMPETVLEGVGDLAPILAPGVVAAALRELAEETGIHVEAGALTYAGRWLTPPLGPMRFDNRFFLAEWHADLGEPGVQGGEATHGEWVEPAAALERWRGGDLLAAPPILYLLDALRDGVDEGSLRRVRAPEDANLGPYRRVEFSPGTLLFPLPTPTLPPATVTNCYLVGTGEAVLVDPGSPFEREIDRLVDGLAAAERAGRRAVAIWLTHHHPDHVGGVEALRERLDLPVLAHRLTAERLAERGVRVDGGLADGERLELAGDPALTLRAIHTPGHARGHLCFLEERFGALIAGDMVAGVGTIVIDPPEGDMDDYLASLERLVALAPRRLLPAHGPAVADGVGRLKQYVAHRLDRERRVLEAWRSGLREPAAILAHAYDEIPPGAEPLAARQIVAHLERLRRRGRLTAPGRSASDVV